MTAATPPDASDSLNSTFSFLEPYLDKEPLNPVLFTDECYTDTLVKAINNILQDTDLEAEEMWTLICKAEHVLHNKGTEESFNAAPHQLSLETVPREELLEIICNQIKPDGYQALAESFDVHYNINISSKHYEKLYDKYWKLVWWARAGTSDDNDYWSDVPEDMKTFALNEAAIIEEQHPDECAAIKSESGDWHHGFHSGMLACLRYITAAERSIADADKEFPDLDT